MLAQAASSGSYILKTLAGCHAVMALAPRPRGRPRGTRVHRDLRAEAELVWRAQPAPVHPANPEVGKNLAAARAAARETRLAVAVEPAQTRLEPKDEELVLDILQGKTVVTTEKGREAKAVALLGASVRVEAWSEFNGLLADIGKDIDEERCRGVMFALTRAYDETPQRAVVRARPSSASSSLLALSNRHVATLPGEEILLRGIGEPLQDAASSDAAVIAAIVAGGNVVTARSSARIMAHFRGFAILLAYQTEGGKEEYISLRGSLPPGLMAVDRQTKEMLAALLPAFRSLAPSATALVERCFPHRYVLSTADSFSSNVGAEHVDEVVHEGWKHTYIRCEMHRVDTAESRTTSLIPRAVSGLVNLGCFFDKHKGDVLGAFQSWLESVPLRVYQGRPPADVLEKRKFLLQTYAPSSDAGGAEPSSDAGDANAKKVRARTFRRLAWETLFNGDLSQRGHVEHYEIGCCPREDTRQKMMSYGVAWLTEQIDRLRWERGDWTKHEDAAEVAGALDATHGMLSYGVRKLCDRNHQTEATETQATWHQAAAKERQKVLDFVDSPTFRHDVAMALHVARWFAHVKSIMLGGTAEESALRRAASLAAADLGAAPGDERPLPGSSSDAEVCSDASSDAAPAIPNFQVTRHLVPGSDLDGYLSAAAKETFCAAAWPDCDSSEASALDTFILGSRRGAALFQLVAVPAAGVLPRVLAGNYDPGIDAEVRKLHEEAPCVFCPVSGDIMTASVPDQPHIKTAVADAIRTEIIMVECSHAATRHLSIHGIAMDVEFSLLADQRAVSWRRVGSESYFVRPPPEASSSAAAAAVPVPADASSSAAVVVAPAEASSAAAAAPAEASSAAAVVPAEASSAAAVAPRERGAAGVVARAKSKTRRAKGSWKFRAHMREAPRTAGGQFMKGAGAAYAEARRDAAADTHLSDAGAILKAVAAGPVLARKKRKGPRDDDRVFLRHRVDALRKTGLLPACHEPNQPVSTAVADHLLEQRNDAHFADDARTRAALRLLPGLRRQQVAAALEVLWRWRRERAPHLPAASHLARRYHQLHVEVARLSSDASPGLSPDASAGLASARWLWQPTGAERIVQLATSAWTTSTGQVRAAAAADHMKVLAKHMPPLPRKMPRVTNCRRIGHCCCVAGSRLVALTSALARATRAFMNYRRIGDRKSFNQLSLEQGRVVFKFDTPGGPLWYHAAMTYLAPALRQTFMSLVPVPAPTRPGHMALRVMQQPPYRRGGRWVARHPWRTEAQVLMTLEQHDRVVVSFWIVALGARLDPDAGPHPRDEVVARHEAIHDSVLWPPALVEEEAAAEAAGPDVGRMAVAFEGRRLRRALPPSPPSRDRTPSPPPATPPLVPPAPPTPPVGPPRERERRPHMDLGGMGTIQLNPTNTIVNGVAVCNWCGARVWRSMNRRPLGFLGAWLERCPGPQREHFAMSINPSRRDPPEGGDEAFPFMVRRLARDRLAQDPGYETFARREPDPGEDSDEEPALFP